MRFVRPSSQIPTLFTPSSHAQHHDPTANHSFPEQVPEDLQSILNDSTLFSANADITTKEILKRYADLSKTPAPSTSSTNGANGVGPGNLPSVAESILPASQQPVIHKVDAADINPPQAPTTMPQTLYGTPPMGGQPSSSSQGYPTSGYPTSGFPQGHAAAARTATPPNGFYNQNGPGGSRDSFGLGRESPARMPAR